MKHKTSELTGALLDAAVISALGMTDEDAAVVGLGCPDWRDHFRPSSSWAHGGPIIERERIVLDPRADDEFGEEWAAGVGVRHEDDGWLARHFAEGPTPLIAAMRAFVASKLGDDVDLP